MNVLSIPERFHQNRVARHMGQQAQFNLRIVRHDEFPSRTRDECRANLPAQLRSNGNVLQIRVRRREPSRGGARLVETGVQAARARVDQRRQRIDVRALELGELAVLEDFAHDFVLLREILQYVGRG